MLKSHGKNAPAHMAAASTLQAEEGGEPSFINTALPIKVLSSDLQAVPNQIQGF